MQGDVYARLLEEPDQSFDLIVIDVDHSPDEQLADDECGFYSEQGLRKAKQHLRPGGVLAVWSYEESSPFADALARVFEATTVAEINSYNALVHHSQTDWLFFGST